MKVIQQLNSRATQDGDGINISRIPGFDGKYLDPFLMIDELKSDDHSDFMGGFPAHPHRGIETFTYIIKGGKYEKRNERAKSMSVSSTN